MKTLYIVRHAKSSWDDAALDDFERPLNKRGLDDAPRMGRRLKERALNPDLFLSSPAKRALHTAKLIAEKLGYGEKAIKTESRLYHASEDTILEIVKEFDNQLELVMLFGHNPGLTDFVNELSDTDPKIFNVPTCGIAAFTLRVKTWQEVKFGCGSLLVYDFPKQKPH